MAIERVLDNTLNSRSKIAIIRLFASKANDFMASGREIARLTGISAPAIHSSSKELYNEGILKRDIIGKQHIYQLDANCRAVKELLRPIFKKELSTKEQVKKFLIRELQRTGIKNKIISVILYGSFAKGKADAGSDVDIAVIIKERRHKKYIEDKFLTDISVKFNNYFKSHLDVYVKTAEEFHFMRRKNLSPISTLMKFYTVIWGREPLDI